MMARYLHPSWAQRLLAVLMLSICFSALHGEVHGGRLVTSLQKLQAFKQLVGCTFTLVEQMPRP